MKLSMVLPSIPVEMETSEGILELKVTKFTVADGERRERLVTPVFNDENTSNVEKYNAFYIARIMCSLKYQDGTYFFNDGDVNTVANQLGKELTDALAKLVDELNPLPLPPEDEQESALEAKKK